MRRLILIAALMLASASAEAGQSRGLTLAANDEPATITQPASPAAAPASTDAPKYVERPAAVGTGPAPDQPKAAAASEAKPVVKAERRKHRAESTEARVIYELHRHGIYW